MSTTMELEKQRARAVAEEYRQKGYEVIEEPIASQLPDFLAGYQPDLLAWRGNEAVIVEVKARSSLGKAPQISQLAKLLRGKPGWDFELVVVGESGQLDLPEDAQPLGREEIAQWIAASESLLESEHYEAALLLAWSALEATLRLLLNEEDPSLGRVNSEHVLNHAVVNGVLSRDDYNSLMKVRKYRNAVAHGFEISDFEFSIGYIVIKSPIERLLQSAAEL
jgi:hypothetical protein